MTALDDHHGEQVTSTHLTRRKTPMNADVLTTTVADGIAVITLGSAKRIYFCEEMGDSITSALEDLAGNPAIRVVVVTGGAPGYFIRHFSISSLLRLAEATRGQMTLPIMAGSSTGPWHSVRACQSQ